MFGKKQSHQQPASINIVAAQPRASQPSASMPQPAPKPARKTALAEPVLSAPNDFADRLRRAASNPLKAAGGPISPQAHDLRQTLRAIEATFYVVDQIRDLVVETCHIVLRANTIDDTAGRALLAEQYDEMRHSISRLVASADEDAVRLVGPEAQGIVSRLNTQSSYTVFPSPLGLGANGLDLPPPHQGFADISEIADILGKLDQALDKLDSVSAFYMKDAQFLMSKLTGHE